MKTTVSEPRTATFLTGLLIGLLVGVLCGCSVFGPGIGASVY